MQTGGGNEHGGVEVVVSELDRSTTLRWMWTRHQHPFVMGLRCSAWSEHVAAIR